MYSSPIDPKKLKVSLEVLNSLMINFLEETHDMAVIRKYVCDPASEVYMPIARNMADAQQVALIISKLLSMADEKE